MSESVSVISVVLNICIYSVYFLVCWHAYLQPQANVAGQSRASVTSRVEVKRRGIARVVINSSEEKDYALIFYSIIAI